jgi:hypothetical protein
LNIEADILAEEAYSSSTFPDQVPMIPGVSVQLLIDGKTILSKHRVLPMISGKQRPSSFEFRNRQE